MRKKKKSLLREAYKKQIKRLRQAVRYGEKQGYIFENNLIPKLPKRVTKKALQKITTIKPSDLYVKARYVDKDTGEIISGTARRREVRRQASLKAARTRAQKAEYYPTITIIGAILDRISNLKRESKPPLPIEVRKNELLKIFDDTITMYSDNLGALEQYLVDNQSDIFDNLDVITYESKSEMVAASFVRVAIILNTHSLSQYQAESVSMMAEYYN